MNSVTDNDLELLEAWLDDELSADDAVRVGGRLADEPELSAALAELKQERSMRQTFFAALEPDDKSASQFEWRISGAIRRQQVFAQRIRFAKRAGAIAACLAVAFVAGFLVRGRAPLTPPTAGGCEVVLTDESGQTIVQRFNTMQEAERFTRELKQYQERQRNARTGGTTTLLSDSF